MIRTSSVVFVVICWILCFGLSAQEWRDSLRSAHDSYRKGQFDEAQRKFHSAQQLAPGDVDLTKDIGTSAYRNSDYKTAEEAFVASAKKTDDPSARARKFHNAGNAQMKQKNYQAAVDSYKHALRANPNSEETRYNLAEAQRRLKKDQEQQQQEQKQQEDQQNQEDQDGQGDGQSNDNQNQQSDQNNQDNSQNQNQQNNQNSSSNQSEGGQQKLSDKKTERMLDELMKKEMETKRRMQGMGSGSDKEEVKSGKRW
jgi:Ca-activated chloride channel homolog